MQESSSPQSPESLQRAVLALALDRHPAHLPRRELHEEMGGDYKEVEDAVRFLVRSRLLRWEEEALAVTVPALVFDHLAL